MSRTYRKSASDHNDWYRIRKLELHAIYGDGTSWFDKWHVRKNRDGAGEHTETLKWHSNRLRRSNDKKIVNDFYRGVDPENLDYKDDRDLRYLQWVYD